MINSTVSYYNSGSNFNQSINSVADFTNAGVTGPGGMPLASTDAVSGFDFTGYTDNSGFSSSSIFTSGALTLTVPNGQYFSNGTGVFQSSVMLNSGETLSGLSNVLQPNTSYTLDLFANPIDGGMYGFGTTENVTFTYGNQTGSEQNVTGDVAVPFSFTTGSNVSDGLSFDGTSGTTNGDDFASITGFAIVNEVPEPATDALMLAGLGLLGALVLRRRRGATTL